MCSFQAWAVHTLILALACGCPSHAFVRPCTSSSSIVAHPRSHTTPIAERGPARHVTSLSSSSYLDQLDDAPSDTGSSDYDNEPQRSPTAQQQRDLKDDLLSQIELGTSGKKRTAVNELLLKLEQLNPTTAPAKDKALNGVWEFLYTGGNSPGVLGIQLISTVAKQMSGLIDLKAVTLTLQRDQPRVEAAVRVSIMGSEQTLKVRTRLVAETDSRLKETYEGAELAGYSIPIPQPLQVTRNIFITYLDDDILIARDDSGAPDLLVRKEKDFRYNDGVPSASDWNDDAPGSG